MAFTIEERDNSRTITSGASPQAVLRYVVRGVGGDPGKDDEIEAIEALEAFAPATFMGLLRDTVRIEPVHLPAPPDESIWNGEAAYSPAQSVSTGPPLNEGESSFSFDTGGATQRITQSIATTGTFAAPGETAPDFQGAVGVTENGVEGVEIGVPQMQFTETHAFSDAFVTEAYRAQVALNSWKTNDAIFRGFAIGEVLFMGASGSQRGDGLWEITFRFSASPNRTAVTIGPITGIAKGGHEHLWVFHEEMEDATAERVVKRPIAAYAERVFESMNFATILGI